jgi:adenine phosphoribosyltransferase
MRLVEGLGGRIAGLAFVVELGFLDGRARLNDHDILSLVTFDGS